MCPVGTFEGQGFCELFLLTLRAFLLTHSSCGNAYLKSGHFIDGNHDMLQKNQIVTHFFSLNFLCILCRSLHCVFLDTERQIRAEDECGLLNKRCGKSGGL